MAPSADEQQLKLDHLYEERSTRWCGLQCPDIQLTPEYPQVGLDTRQRFMVDTVVTVAYLHLDPTSRKVRHRNMTTYGTVVKPLIRYACFTQY